MTDSPARTDRRDSSRRDWARQVENRPAGSRLAAWDPRAERLVRSEERHAGDASGASSGQGQGRPATSGPETQPAEPAEPTPTRPPEAAPGGPELTPAPAGPRSSGAVSMVQVAGSALAAVSAAVVSSSFGVAGTVIGAAVASVVATVGSAVYSASLRRTNERLRRLASERRFPGAPTVVLPPSLRQNAPTGNRSLRRGLSGLRRRWPAVLGAAALVFVITIGVLTLVESATHKPVSSLVGGSSSGGTSVGRLFGGSSTSSRPAPASGVPSSAQPSTAPTSAAPTSAAPSPSAAPTSAAPTAAPPTTPPTQVPSAAVPSAAATP